MSQSVDALDKKIEAQLEKLKQLKSQKQAIQNRERTKRKEQERKEETRRKILVGSMYLKRMAEDENFNQQVLSHLDKYLTEERDRKLFFKTEVF